MSRVSVVKCADYSNVEAAIKKSMKLLGGMERFFKKGKKVLLKPNISGPLPPDRASNTHPLFVKAVIETIKKTGAEIWVGECSAGGSPGITRKCLEISGIGDIIQETDVEFKNFEEGKFILKNIPNFKVLEKTDFAETIFHVDLMVNLPKLKTHGLTFMTGSIKNCFGCVHPLERQYLHRNFPDREHFNQGLVDIYSLVRPKLTLMDTIVGMEGDQGPSFGNPKKIGAIIAGEDGVAVDAVAATIIGYHPLAIPMIKYADERGIGTGDMGKIEVAGEKVENVVVRGFKQHPLFDNKYRKMHGFGNTFIMVPELIASKCIKCRTCENNCPVGAIDMNPYPTINREKCIMCYCCHETCPSGAYKLKIKWLRGHNIKKR